ncbi:MAG: [citrate (pro-3S)-lyase] ligase [Peptostreptococcaceae bacterium]|nr:[citrate (pro-3S)-lyase] ligase [Peptostreptococcaceae bacterium]
MQFTTSTIFPRDKYSMKLVEKLLEQENIKRDANLDFTIGLFHDDELVATGSSYKNTLRCFAVDSKYQGYALMNTLVTELLNRQNDLGYDNTFVYTKRETGKFFEDLGFYPIGETERLVFLENKKGRFADYLKKLQTESPTPNSDARITSIVMNANPFTLGHLYLVEKAASENDLLHLFMVSDDSSLIPFSVRKKLILEGTEHLNNIIYHETSSYMISQSIFPSYFIKEENDIILEQANLDIQIFLQIAKALGIRSRYIGSEPFSRVTNLYNQVMQEKLPPDVQVHLIERKSENDLAISASKVRELIQNNRLDEIKNLVPKSTYDFFTSSDAEEIIRKIQAEKDVVHY